MKLIELAERCEAADADEQRALLKGAADCLWGAFAPDGADPVLWVRRWVRFNRMLDAEAYESAALMLVPEGWSWSIGDLRGYDPPIWRAHFRDCRPQSLTPAGHSHIWREGNTVGGPALALCAAALRARAAMEGK